MTNKEIAKSFNLLANLIELHGENSFRIKTYANAYVNLRKIESPFCKMTAVELAELPGVGTTIAEKIVELCSTGTLVSIEEFKKVTPVGILDMLSVRGLGPKKILTIWKELNIESVGELLYACQENRLVSAKGFGAKTQVDIMNKLQYFMDSKGKFHYASLVNEAEELLGAIHNNFPNDKTEFYGELRRKMPEVRGIEILTTVGEELYSKIPIEKDDEKEGLWEYKGFPVFITTTKPDRFGTDLFIKSCSDEFLQAIRIENEIPICSEEMKIFELLNAKEIPSEYRESRFAWQEAKDSTLPRLIEDKDIIGIVHNHTTYSDGLHSVMQMAEHSQKSGYKYIVISDHSQSAFYANGLSVERVEMQWREIDECNAKLRDFKIYKGIESDILNDGKLDYPDDVLAGFEVVIASIHSNLRMDEEKATERLIKAIENPYTTILGHPTGRLLLGREGYPINHRKVIDACAANGVVMELNANPQRLDVDWKWLRYCFEKDVKISINPDAHSMDQIKYIKYGINVARKGGLSAEMCWNTRLPAIKK